MGAIDTLLLEARRYPPPAWWRKNALLRGRAPRPRTPAERVRHWEREARRLLWRRPWRRALDWKPPHAKWFVGGRLNACENCVDRHVREGRGNKAAIVWEGEPGEVRVLTYRALLREVRLFAGALRRLGVKRGDRVGIYLPMVPEAAIAMLACARLGAAHSVVFGGFSAESLRDRMNDAGAKVLITADAGWRRGGLVPLKENADRALEGCPTVERSVVLRRTATPVPMKEGRDLWWHEIVKEGEPDGEPEAHDAEQVLFLLYTSGTTGKPKGIVHTTGGYMTGALSTTRAVFDLREDDVFWCTADVGWVTGHSYVVYGPLALGATVVMYEGAPDWPDRGRFWDIAERHGVTVFYTAPTAIRAFMKWGAEWPAKRDLSALRLLGSVGEPINPEAWVWYREHIGGSRCPVVDTWWQTETGSILVAPLPGITTTRPGSATFPLPGIEVDVVDEAGNRVPVGGGYLVVREPWPSMLRTIWGDDERYRKTYFGRWGDSVYVTGDGARRDEDGCLWLLGRVDDVLNVAGHRIGTAEVESALVEHPSVAEAAVVGRPDALKGQALVAFVSLRVGAKGGPDAVRKELREFVAKKIGALARPDDVHLAADLPKTRSGKIMRRLLRDIAEGRKLGDTTTLADPAVVQALRDQFEGNE
ncbi:MAG TPA: acetate--CoA ligase [Planctomycetota bacterium]|nr:acetate--CoA ligase [Planctomycetota bacterium]